LKASQGKEWLVAALEIDLGSSKTTESIHITSSYTMQKSNFAEHKARCWWCLKLEFTEFEHCVGQTIAFPKRGTTSSTTGCWRGFSRCQVGNLWAIKDEKDEDESNSLPQWLLDLVLLEDNFAPWQEGWHHSRKVLKPIVEKEDYAGGKVACGRWFRRLLTPHKLVHPDIRPIPSLAKKMTFLLLQPVWPRVSNKQSKPLWWSFFSFLFSCGIFLLLWLFIWDNDLPSWSDFRRREVRGKRKKKQKEKKKGFSLSLSWFTQNEKNKTKKQIILWMSSKR